MIALPPNRSLKWLFIYPVLFFSFSARAQSLPNVQKVAVYSEGKIKIDGKAQELNDSFQAYNKATDCFYTLSNDESNLYLTIQARMDEIVSKVLMGGITLSISTNRDKKAADGIQLTYPMFEGGEKSTLTNMRARKMNEMRESKSTEIDVAALNKALSAYSKNFRIKGMGGSTEEVLSIYNEEGIKAAAQFDSKLFYTYELQLPLKYIKALQNGSSSFKYNIQINPPDEKPFVPGPNAPPPPPMMNTALSATDFWGEYTLAKRPG